MPTFKENSNPIRYKKSSGFKMRSPLKNPHPEHPHPKTNKNEFKKMTNPNYFNNKKTQS
jgi:hypothetical protein